MGGQRDLELTMRRYALRDDQWDRIKAWCRAGGPCRRDGEGQPAVRGGRAVSLSGRHSVAGLARAVWRSGNDPYAVQPMGKERGLGEGFQTPADDADNEYAMINSTIVRAHQHSAGARKKGVRIKPSGARAEG